MPLSNNINDLEKAKFTERGGQTTVAVTPFNSLVSSKWDYYEATYPTDTDEIHNFYFNSILVCTIEIEYVDSTKENLKTVAKTFGD